MNWIKLYFKDSNDMKEVADESIQLIATSPDACFISKPPPSPISDNKAMLYTAFNVFTRLYKALFNECYRILKPNGVFLWNIGVDPKLQREPSFTMPFAFVMPFASSLSILWATDFRLEIDFITIKLPPCNLPYLVEGKVLQAYDHWFMFTKSDEYKLKTDNPLATVLFLQEQPNPVKLKDHGTIMTPFPESLLCYFLTNFTDENDTVLDPFAGCGTLAKVSGPMKRNCILYEKNVDMFPYIKEQLSSLKLETKFY